MDFTPQNVIPGLPPPSAAECHAAARRYISSGLSIIPISPDGSKRPAYGLLPVTGQKPDGSPKRGWSPFRERLATEPELSRWYENWGPPPGIAVIGGAVSGGLEILDFDAFDLVRPWAEAVDRLSPGLLDRLICVQTPRPGLHAYYRSPGCSRNQVLAQRAVVSPDDPVPKPKTTIETRAEGGYALIPPSPYYCHPSGRPYLYLGGRDLTCVAQISEAERNVLVEAARALTEHEFIVRERPARPPVAPRPLDVSKPGDDFESRVEWTSLLEQYGWTFASADGSTEYWRRPGKTDGVSASLDYQGNGKLYVFSTNASPLDSETSYSKFAFVTAMEYGGDFQRAANALRERGYGRPILAAGNRRRRVERRRRSRRRR